MSEKLELLQPRSTEETPDSDVLPTIECALGVGQLVDDIEIDAHYFASLMREHGMSDETISDSVIKVSDDLIITRKDKDKGNEILQYGVYTHDKQTATVWLGSIKDGTDYVKEKRDSEDPPRPYDSNRFGSRWASEVTVHETSHRIDHATGDEWREEKYEYYAQFAPERRVLKAIRKCLHMTKNTDLGRIANALRVREVYKNPSHEQYQNAPDELRAEELSDRESANWKENDDFPIRVKFK
ncbi:MAG TPA: hypothetical protein VK497_03935 [Candidatus Saccharimonadales bacterium]|nr:hypothetical protein [Candidatus Saccharimonadales bacterium]